MSLYYGAAVQVSGGTTTMNRCTFKNNIANEGGHIAVMNDSVLNMTECTMTEGQAGQNGGAIYYNSSAAQYGEISSSVIHANSAGSSGGGIYVASGNLIVNPTSKLYGNTAPTGEDMTALVTGQGSYTDNLETLNALFAEDNIQVNAWEMTQDPDTATKYYKLNYEEIIYEQPGDSEDTGDDTTDTSDQTTPGEGDSTDEPSDPGTGEDTTDPSVPGEDEGDDNQEDTTQPGDSDQDSTEDPAAPDAGDSEQDSTDNGGNTDNSSNNGNTTNTTENSGNTTNTDNSSNDNTTVDNSSNDVVTDNSDHSSTDNSQTDNSQTTIDNSDHSTTTNTSDNSSHDTNTTTTNNSSDNSSKTTTTDNSQRSEDNSSVVTTYNYYQNPENQSQVQSGQQMQPIVVNNYIQPSQEGQQVEEADDPSNNIKIDAEGVDVVFEVVDGVYSISIKAANEPQAVQTAVVPASNQATEPASSVNWYEIIKIGLLLAILVNVLWKPRQNSPA